MNIQYYLAQCKRNLLITLMTCMFILAAGYTWVIYNQLHNCFEQHIQHTTAPEHQQQLWQDFQSQWFIVILISIAFMLASCLFLSRSFNKTQGCLHQQHASLTDLAEQRTQTLEETNAELKAFAYSVSHDLRGPLRSLDGFALALDEDYGDKLDEQGKDFIMRIRAASQRMATLIDAMLVLSRVSHTELHILPVNLSEMAEKTIIALQKEQPTRRVQVSIQPNMTTMADPVLLKQVIENLLNNAWKFSQPREQAEITFYSQCENNQCIYTISDNGVGFDNAYQGKLFTPFQRLHQQNEFAGTGIGLPIVQRIIHRHGGIISAESAIDKGAKFSFNLPNQVVNT